MRVEGKPELLYLGKIGGMLNVMRQEMWNNLISTTCVSEYACALDKASHSRLRFDCFIMEILIRVWRGGFLFYRTEVYSSLSQTNFHVI